MIVVITQGNCAAHIPRKRTYATLFKMEQAGKCLQPCHRYYVLLVCVLLGWRPIADNFEMSNCR